jgi:hypothetical protein
VAPGAHETAVTRNMSAAKADRTTFKIKDRPLDFEDARVELKSNTSFIRSIYTALPIIAVFSKESRRHIFALMWHINCGESVNE